MNAQNTTTKTLSNNEYTLIAKYIRIKNVLTEITTEYLIENHSHILAHTKLNSFSKKERLRTIVDFLIENMAKETLFLPIYHNYASADFVETVEYLFQNLPESCILPSETSNQIAQRLLENFEPYQKMIGY